jgi:hypothetical protein
VEARRAVKGSKALREGVGGGWTVDLQYLQNVDRLLVLWMLQL